MVRLRQFFTIMFFGVVLLIASQPVLAAPTPSDCPPGTPSNATCLKNPLQGGPVAAEDIIGIIIKGALSIVGALTLLMMVWGGFQWLTSAGNSEKVEAGSKTMLWAAIGVFLVFASYLILSTFTNLLTAP